MTYGYARVSSRGQATDGTSLDSQIAELKAAGATRIYSEAFTGTRRQRPELDKLMSRLGSGDTLVVTKLDRIARSTVHGYQIIEELIARGVTVHVLNMGVLDDKPASKLMRTMFLAFAEFERDLIAERTSEGKAVRRAELGDLWREGRPPKDRSGFLTLLPKTERGEMTVTAACDVLGISRASWYQWKNELEDVS